MRLKYRFELVELDDQIIAVPVDKGAMEFQGVIKLNKSAASVFKMLEKDITESEIIDSIEKEYEADYDTLANDVRNCIAELRGKGLLTE